MIKETNKESINVDFHCSIITISKLDKIRPATVGLEIPILVHFVRLKKKTKKNEHPENIVVDRVPDLIFKEC